RSHWLARALLERRQQIARRAAAEALLLQVRAQAVPERLGSEIALEHREQGGALGVGDGIERVADVVVAGDGLPDLTRAPPPIHVESALQGRDGRHPRAVFLTRLPRASH